MNLLKKFTLLKALIFIFSSDGALYKFILKNYKSSNSQIFQDLFALYYTRPQKNGFFVEVGVGNGKDLSNTYILEKKQTKRRQTTVETNGKHQGFGGRGIHG